ncbi:uncharacterized protein LOC143079408 isoform X2 [Mytilus galloprovincialis]|uniref:uncharacterized protein LOC143079408 isoform X2 n=1 Tax=Mytilus galloprovincialis TaxID=29158 RepID=UPI003F7B9EB9
MDRRNRVHGVVSRKQAEMVAKKVGMTTEKVQESGTIDFDEFVKIFAQKMSIDPEKELHEIFCVFDKNKDGFISSEELYEVLSKLGESITKDEAYLMIKEADLDRDGKVNYTDFKAILNFR